MNITRFLGATAICVGALTINCEAKAETFKGCGMTVDYQVEGPPAGLSPAATSLYGVWMGVWDNVLCSALIIESIKPDGAVRARYIYGTYSGWGIAQPGVNTWTGTFSNNKLVFKGTRGGADYTISGAGKLDGTYYTANNAPSKGTFVKK